MSDILKNLIEINTINDKENEKIRTYIKSLLKDKNFDFQEIGEDKEKVLIAKRGNPTVAFCCHTDTVDKSIYWTKEALKLTEDKDNYYGLGVSDMKGGTAALLEVVTTLPTDIPCMLCFTYDEEISFKGITELIKNNINLPDTIIFPEPTDLVPAIANKGCIEFSITFNGKSAHSSTPELGENALYKALDFIKEVKDFATELRKEKLPLYEVPYTTFNLSKINGGNEINKVPDTCEITFDFRTITKEHNKKIIAKITELTEKYQGKASILNNLNAAVTNKKEVIEKIETITNQKAIGLNYVTEASFLPDKNIIILGPGPITAHQKDEKIRKESFNKCQEIYRKIILEQQ